MDLKTILDRLNRQAEIQSEDIEMSTNPEMLIREKRQNMSQFPNDDVQAVVDNIKSDSNNTMDIISGAGNFSGGLATAGGQAASRFGGLLANKYGGKVKDLAEEYLPKGISDKITDIYHAGKRVNNTDMMNKGTQEMGRIKALNELAEQTPRFKVDDIPDSKPFDLDVFQRNLDVQKTMEAQDAAKSILRDSGIVQEETKALTELTKKKK